MRILRGVQQRRFGPDDIHFHRNGFEAVCLHTPYGAQFGHPESMGFVFSDLQALVVLSLDTLTRRVSLSPGLILLSDSSRVRGTLCIPTQIYV